MFKIVLIVLGVIVIIGGVIGGYVLAAVILQYAWNILAREVFNGPQIQLAHAILIIFLLSLVGGALKSSVTVSR